MRRQSTAHVLAAPSLPNDETALSPDELEALGLPPANTLRWDTKRKAKVVNAVCAGHLSLERACDIYAMSVDEFLSWQSLLERYGAKALMATRVKEYRTKRAS